MAYTAAKLIETNLPTIIVNKYDLNEKYPDIGSGDEGEVYNYCNQYALKTFGFFRAMEYFYGEQLINKFAKIEAMVVFIYQHNQLNLLKSGGLKEDNLME